VFAPPANGRQTFDAYIATGPEARAAEAVGTKVVDGAEVSFGTTANVITSGSYKFFAGSRSDAFFFDYDGVNNLFDTSGGRNFTAPHLGGQSPWPGVDSNAALADFLRHRREALQPGDVGLPAGVLTRGIEADVLPTCARYGMGVIPYSPLAGGYGPCLHSSAAAPAEPGTADPPKTALCLRRDSPARLTS
jgi:hypothetical protein